MAACAPLYPPCVDTRRGLAHPSTDPCWVPPSIRRGIIDALSRLLNCRSVKSAYPVVASADNTARHQHPEDNHTTPVVTILSRLIAFLSGPLKDLAPHRLIDVIRHLPAAHLDAVCSTCVSRPHRENLRPQLPTPYATRETTSRNRRKVGTSRAAATTSNHKRTAAAPPMVTCSSVGRAGCASRNGSALHEKAACGEGFGSAAG